MWWCGGLIWWMPPDLKVRGRYLLRLGSGVCSKSFEKWKVQFRTWTGEKYGSIVTLFISISFFFTTRLLWGLIFMELLAFRSVDLLRFEVIVESTPLTRSLDLLTLFDVLCAICIISFKVIWGSIVAKLHLFGFIRGDNVPWLLMLLFLREKTAFEGKTTIFFYLRTLPFIVFYPIILGWVSWN